MAAAKKNTAGRKAPKNKMKRWVVEVEAVVSAFLVVESSDEEQAIVDVDQALEDAKVDLLGGKKIPLDEFSKLFERAEVHGALALDDVFPAKATKKTAAKKTTPKKKTTAKTAPKGRTRGAAKATDPKTGKKAKTPAKAGSTKTSTKPRGRTRGGKS